MVTFYPATSFLTPHFRTAGHLAWHYLGILVFHLVLYYSKHCIIHLSCHYHTEERKKQAESAATGKYLPVRKGWRLKSEPSPKRPLHRPSLTSLLSTSQQLNQHQKKIPVKVNVLPAESTTPIQVDFKVSQSIGSIEDVEPDMELGESLKKEQPLFAAGPGEAVVTAPRSHQTLKRTISGPPRTSLAPDNDTGNDNCLRTTACSLHTVMLAKTLFCINKPSVVDSVTF